jgi:2-polyprenyl-3-methyl-5-hydroxy-6-metoxy-1,4-benzoquinol methylase
MNNKRNEIIDGDNYADGLNDNVTRAMGLFGGYRSASILYKKEYVNAIISRFSFRINTVLDFGCGTGLYTKLLKEIFPHADIYGCDVSGEAIKIAKNDVPGCRFDQIIDKSDLAGKYGRKFDLVFINCVLHHIPHDEHISWLRALKSTIRNGGVGIIIFEMNPYNPLVQIMQKKNKVMEEHAVLLKPGYCKAMMNEIFGNATGTYTFLFPWRKMIFKKIEHLCGRLPFGAQYYVASFNNNA